MKVASRVTDTVTYLASCCMSPIRKSVLEELRVSRLSYCSHHKEICVDVLILKASDVTMKIRWIERKTKQKSSSRLLIKDGLMTDKRRGSGMVSSRTGLELKKILWSWP